MEIFGSYAGVEFKVEALPVTPKPFKLVINLGPTPPKKKYTSGGPMEGQRRTYARSPSCCPCRSAGLPPSPALVKSPENTRTLNPKP